MSNKLTGVIWLLMVGFGGLVFAQNDTSMNLEYKSPSLLKGSPLKNVQLKTLPLDGLLLDSTISVSKDFSCKPTGDIKELFDLHNQARRNGVSCGRNRSKTSTKLRYSCELTSASMRHAKDLARYSFLKHVGSDGSDLGERATESDYVWRRVGENIAMGFNLAADVNKVWLTSSGHCKNIINSDYIDMGAARVDKYWVVMFGRR